MLTERVWDPGNQNGKELTEDLEYPGSLSHPTVPHTVSLPDKRDDTAIAMYTELEFILGMDDILEDKEKLSANPAGFLHSYCPKTKFVKQSKLGVCCPQSSCWQTKNLWV